MLIANASDLFIACGEYPGVTIQIKPFFFITFLIFTVQLAFCKRVSMGLTDRRKTAKKLVDSRKN